MEVRKKVSLGIGKYLIISYLCVCQAHSKLFNNIPNRFT